MNIINFFEYAAEWIDVFGVVIIVFGMVMATLHFLIKKFSNEPDSYDAYRKELGKTLLLALEFLVAADIIRTVAIEPTLESIAILSVLILIRTFMSTALELEITGSWPWQKGAKTTKDSSNIETP